ncbi:MAG: hypothetical protein RDU76_03430 [Candidatus Edwardsbacteria bacterium]|nr:hypothetical protein [Candidatus Edwardsbacteria bacterium]
MEVKGTSVLATKNFVNHKFGPEAQKAWLESLPGESRKIFDQAILANNWYPFQAGFVEPTRMICNSFYGGNELGAREIGRYSAEQSLRGIYKAFARVASVNFIMERTANIFKTYYTPGRMEVASQDQHHLAFHILDIDDSDLLFEHRICGWINGALLICNNRDHEVKIARSVARGDTLTEILVAL